MLMRSFLKRIVTSPSLIAVVAFAWRIHVLIQFRTVGLNPIRTNIPFGYELGAVAASIAAGHGFSSPLHWYPTGPTAWFGPIYPYLAAGVFKILGIYSYSSFVVLSTINAAFSALTCIPIFLTGKKSFGITTGAGAAWVWVFLPNAVVFPLIWIWDTALSALCMAVILYATLALRDSPRVRNWAGYGALWAFSALVNPSLLAVLPFFLAWLVLEQWRAHQPWVRGAATCVLLFVIGLVPWTIRNAVVFHKFIPLRSNFGLELWLGNNPGTADNDTAYQHPNDDPAEGELYRKMGELPYMALKQRQALEFMRSHPSDVFRLTYHRVVGTWIGAWEPMQDAWSTESAKQHFARIFEITFSLLAMFGTLMALRSRNRDAAPYALAILSYPLVFYLTHGSGRYRHPIDPILTLVAVFALVYPFRLFLRWFRTRAEIGEPASVPAESPAP
jgi:hypothetical protein